MLRLARHSELWEVIHEYTSPFFAQCEEIRKFDIQNHAITLSIEMLFEKTYTLYPPRPQRFFLNKTRDLFPKESFRVASAIFAQESSC